MPVLPRRHPLARRPWWQVLPLAVFTYGLLGALIWLYPNPESGGLAAGAILVAIAIPVALWNWRTYAWWSRASLGILSSLFFFILGSRIVLTLSEPDWLWLLPCVAGYALAVTIPVFNPGLSNLIWRELVTPRTRLGRVAMALGLSLLPISGVLGASIGLFARRLGTLRPAMGIGAALVLSAAIIWAFAVSHQFWPERPWRAARGN